MGVDCEKVVDGFDLSGWGMEPASPALGLGLRSKAQGWGDPETASEQIKLVMSIRHLSRYQYEDIGV